LANPSFKKWLQGLESNQRRLALSLSYPAIY